MKLEDIISKSYDATITYEKCSIVEPIGDINCISKCLFQDYQEELDEVAVSVALSDNEYHRYRFRPHLLAYDIYGNSELWFIIHLINNITSAKDFDFRKVKVIPLENISIINKIYNAEQKFIAKYNNGAYDTPEDDWNNSMDNDTLTQFGITPAGQIDNTLTELKYELERIKRTILDIVQQVINGDISELIAQGLKDQIDALRLELIELTKSQIEEIISNGRIYERLDKLEQDSTNIKNVINSLLSLNIGDRLDLLENKMQSTEDKLTLLQNTIGDLVGESVLEHINTLRTEFEAFKNEVYQLIDSGSSDIIDQLVQDVADLKDLIGEGFLTGTKDIVLPLQAPLSPGPQTESEFFVPYTGHIEQFVMSVGVGSKLTSNLILSLQFYDHDLKVWTTAKVYEMHASDRFRIVEDNISISKSNIRLILGAGDYQLVNGITAIVRVRESN